MKIAQVLGGYSLGEGDILRRAMGKKKPEEMAAQRDRFLAGARQRSVPEDKARKLFDLMEKFAGYGFNKSHSAAYALIAYQTAWLKAHYLVPFLASLLSNELGNTDGVVKFIGECKARGVDVLPPDINCSRVDFTIEGAAIRFGLAAVKNLGAGAIDAIVQARRRGGPYSSFEDFLCRVDLRKANKRVLESLIKCGAFDALGHRRSQLLAVLDQALELGQSRQKDQALGQMSLFDAMPETGSEEEACQVLQLPDIPDWSDLDRLAMEKDALGFYISGHPLDPYREAMERMSSVDTGTLPGIQEGARVGLGGLVRSRKEITTKKGDRMAFLVLEDLHGSVEVVCFPEIYSRAKPILEGESPLWVEGTFKREDDRGGDKILAEVVESLDIVCRNRTSGVMIDLQGERIGPSILVPLRDLLRRHQGRYPVRLAITLPGKGRVFLTLPEEFRTDMSPEFSSAIIDLMGYAGLTLEYERSAIEAPA